MAPVTALYCHLPFCHTICPFCAFAVHGNRKALHGPYLAALKKEIRLLAEARDGIHDESPGMGRQGGHPAVASLYFGGGTPSTLPVELVADLIGWIGEHFPLLPGAEIAFELNPEDTSADYLTGLRQAGVNRASLGLQSLHAPTLRALGRNHGPEDGLRALRALKEAGPANFNLDLMFDAPGIGTEPFRADVAQVISAHGEAPPHLSLYGLDVEPRTLFGRDATVLKWAAEGEARQAEQYLWAAETLTAHGYRHYEVSNFSFPGREGRQNLRVWDGENYLGFGLGAHSHVDGTRSHNERHLRGYLRALEGGRLPVSFREELTREQRANEALMLSLRRVDGLNVPRWEETFGFPWQGRQGSVAARLVEEGRATFANGTLVLNARGFLLADAITTQLMVG